MRLFAIQRLLSLYSPTHSLFVQDNDFFFIFRGEIHVWSHKRRERQTSIIAARLCLHIRQTVPSRANASNMLNAMWTFSRQIKSLQCSSGVGKNSRQTRCNATHERAFVYRCRATVLCDCSASEQMVISGRERLRLSFFPRSLCFTTLVCIWEQQHQHIPLNWRRSIRLFLGGCFLANDASNRSTIAPRVGRLWWKCSPDYRKKPRSMAISSGSPSRPAPADEFSLASANFDISGIDTFSACSWSDRTERLRHRRAVGQFVPHSFGRHGIGNSNTFDRRATAHRLEPDLGCHQRCRTVHCSASTRDSANDRISARQSHGREHEHLLGPTSRNHTVPLTIGSAEQSIGIEREHWKTEATVLARSDWKSHSNVLEPTPEFYSQHSQSAAHWSACGRWTDLLEEQGSWSHPTSPRYI